MVFLGETGFQTTHHLVKCRFDGIWYLRGLIFVRVCLHVPNDLMGEQLRELGRLDDVALDVP